MGFADRILAAARSLAAPEQQPPVAPAADVVDDPNVLARGSRGVLGDLWYSTQAMYNAVTGVGTQRDPSYYNAWSVARPLRRSELFGMGRNGLIIQALAKLPNTATREGWRVVVTDPDVNGGVKGGVSDKIAAYEQRLGTGYHCARAMVRGRQYGEAMVLLGIDDGRPMSEPVDTANIRTIRWAAVIDVRYYEPHELYQARDEQFGKVARFNVTDINGILEDGLRYGPNSLSFTSQQLDEERRNQGGQLIVHADRVLHFPTADYLPLLETLQDSLGAFFESMNGIRTAARESSTVVYRVKKWVRKMWSENPALSQLHMATVDRAKSAMNAWIVDKDDEDVDISSRSLGGLADIANPFMVWLSAALAMPVTVLWGVSPGGFGKGEAERETWHEEVHAFQQNVLAPQLRKQHGYILAAADGCQLPATTQREIEFNDLSPPDEETRSKLRSEALSDLRQLVKDGLISKAEARPGVASLSDDYFRPEVDLEQQDEAAPAQVGIFTGSIQLLQAMYPAGIPINAGRNLLLAVDPVHFTRENIAGILPDTAPPSSPETAAGSVTPAPADEEDDAAPDDDEPNEVDVAWSENPLPSDAVEASAIAKELNIPTVRVTRAHKAGLIEGWSVLGGKPRYSLTEVKRVVLRGNGKLPKAESEAPSLDGVRDRRDGDDYSLVLVFRAPRDVALWVPHKERDPSAPHVTLLYVGKVAPAHVLAVLDAARGVLARAQPLELLPDAVAYFDQDGGRIAYLAMQRSPELVALHEELRRAVADTGVEIKHMGQQYTPHLTLAYLAPDEHYTGPVPAEGWTAEVAELWCDDFAIELPLQSRAVTDSEVVVTRDPFANQHAARQRDPADFIESTFRRKDIAPGVAIIAGKLKSDPRGGMVTQTYRFDANEFTPAQAREWLRENKVEKLTLEEAEDSGDLPWFEAEGSGESEYEALEDARCQARDEGLAFSDEIAHYTREFDDSWTCELAVFVRASDMTDEQKRKRIDEAFAKYHETVNMGAAELEAWAETEWSKKASVSREPITRNLRLLSKKKEDWTLADATAAMRTVSFVSRMKGAEQGEPVKIDGREGPSKRDISLKNWAFDPGK